jgi:hypothetical protein
VLAALKMCIAARRSGTAVAMASAAFGVSLPVSRTCEVLEQTGFEHLAIQELLRHERC